MVFIIHFFYNNIWIVIVLNSIWTHVMIEHATSPIPCVFLQPACALPSQIPSELSLQSDDQVYLIGVLEFRVHGLEIIGLHVIVVNCAIRAAAHCLTHFKF